MQKIVFIGAKRTPFGSFGGSFKNTSATDLAVSASLAAIAQSGLNASEISHSIFGNVIQSSPDAAYLARHVALKAGLPENTPAVTVNRLCGSGFEAITQGAHRLLLEEARAILAGGAENMSLCPYVLRQGRFGNKMGNQEVEDSLMAGLFDTYAKLPMAMTAEKLGGQKGISREESDAFALLSQKRAAEATEKGWLAEEIGNVSVSERGKETVVSKDEHIRPGATLEALAKLKSVFKENGLVTAGNASGMVDGAAALVMTTEKHAGKHSLGEYLGSTVVGCDPTIMGIGPVYAIQALLQKLSLKLSQFNAIEINEAFACQTLAVIKDLGIPPEKINENGGAIAIGHPLGASGARLVAHLLYRLKRRGGGLGLASACIGGGQGMAVAVKV
jgi:acetyl-CoA acyltransferase 2